jgi:uncharacterized phiE125 gp8 family phage protein
MYRPVRTAAPAATPVSLAEVKKHVNAPDTGEDDTFLNALIVAAVSHLDGWTGILGRCLISQSWRQDYDCFEHCLRLPLFPVISITSVKYDDPNAAEQTVSASDYSLQTDGLGAYVQFKRLFVLPNISIEPPAVRVVYVAGHAADAPELAVIKQAMLLLIGHWYANREAIVAGSSGAITLPFAVDALLAPLRRVRF